MYTGIISFAPEKKQGQRVVLELAKDLGHGYGVTCDNFFTLLELAKELTKQKQNFAWYNKTNSKGSTNNHVAFQIT